MRAVISILAAVGLLALGGCASKFKSYDGPEVTRVAVFKSSRRLYLMHDDQVLRAYDIGLGFSPIGAKQVEGDGKTPEGDYLIDRRNPNSDYYLSLGISYPNARDMAQARAMGAKPGGDIFIHGEAKDGKRDARDWTAGCIAVTNEAIEDIYAMVRDGTPISIYR